MIVSTFFFNFNFFIVEGAYLFGYEICGEGETLNLGPSL